jgi:hypothetical protein
MVNVIPFVVEGWHAPAGRPDWEPWPLVQARQHRDGTAGGCQEPGIPADRSFRKTTSGVSRLAGQAGTQATDPTPTPRQTIGSRAGSTHPHPPCRLRADLSAHKACRGSAPNFRFGAVLPAHGAHSGKPPVRSPLVPCTTRQVLCSLAAGGVLAGRPGDAGGVRSPRCLKRSAWSPRAASGQSVVCPNRSLCQSTNRMRG